MSFQVENYIQYLPPALRSRAWSAHPLDGKLLLFDRATGTNVLLEGTETQSLRRVAPRTLLIAVTNVCNLACPFCYRDQMAPSLWEFDSLLEFCQAADEWGVLEVAFGGGEPLIFPYWQDFLLELHGSTRLGLNFTTNGTLLTAHFLRAVRGRYGQIRLSIYEDNNWPDAVRLLTSCNARFGVNWLITPRELATIETQFSRLLDLGVRDFLFLSYKGPDPELHCSAAERQRLERFITEAHTRLGRAVALKLDICWGGHLPQVPRLFTESDCAAGDDFLSITSDQRLKPCSFHHVTIPFSTIDDVRTYWERRRRARQAAHIAGCARLPQRGLNATGVISDASFALATIQQ